MKYDVVEYKRWNGDDTNNSPEFIYAITADKGKPIGLTLECESIEMCREFLEWRESHPVKEAWETMDAICVKRRFAEFLKQREEIDALPKTTLVNCLLKAKILSEDEWETSLLKNCCVCQTKSDHCVGWFFDVDEAYCNQCAIEKLERDLKFLKNVTPKQPAAKEKP